MPLGVHVLGPGYGESIILQLPNGHLGVIDSYCDSLGRAVLPKFLREKFKARGLLFLAVTHPHADHCRGVREILDSFDVSEVWAFDAIQLHELRDYYHKLVKDGTPDGVESDLHVPEGTVLRELLEIRKEMRARRQSRPKGKVRLLRSKESFTLCEEMVKITILTPGNGPIVDYREKLSRGITASVTEIVSDEENSVPGVNQNLASTAILVEYGSTRVLLMADAEAPLWKEWAAESGETPGLNVEGVHLIKVAHHGSLNGYDAELYKRACQSSTLAIITPFNRCRSPLPSLEGINEIARHTANVFCTNRAAAANSSSHTWAEFGAATAPVPALPASWAADVKKDSRLTQLLAPPYGSGEGDVKTLTYPARWVQDCVMRKELLGLLRPLVRAARAEAKAASLHEEFLVSVYFDDRGHEVPDRRFLGWGAGVLQAPSRETTASVVSQPVQSK